MLRTTFKISLSALLCLSVGQVFAEAFYSQPLDAKEIAIGNLLAWETVTEIEVASFVIEKSIDGGNVYEELGMVSGAGFSMVDKSYRFMDLNAMHPKNFYRLKEVGTDGTTFYSFPVVLEKKMQNVMKVMAMTNPDVSKNFKLTLDVFAAVDLKCTLASFSGKSLHTFSQKAENGVSVVEMNLENFEPGIYQFKVQVGEEVETIILRRVADEKTTRPPVASRKKGRGGK